MLHGERPIRPENASAIGLSDSLWAFTQRCWGGEVESRPKAREVVVQLGEAAAGWDGLMPPFDRVETVASGPEETTGSEEGDYQIFSTPESPGKKPREVVDGPFEEPQPEKPPDPPLFQLIRESLGNYARKVLRFFGCWR